METHLAPDAHAHFSMRTYIYMKRQNGTTIMRGAVFCLLPYSVSAAVYP